MSATFLIVNIWDSLLPDCSQVADYVPQPGLSKFTFKTLLWSRIHKNMMMAMEHE